MTDVPVINYGTPVMRADRIAQGAVRTVLHHPATQADVITPVVAG